MITTYFRPSIHGWPFGNSWRKSFVFDTVTLDMGFCGGMCWKALQRFYNAIPIDRNIPQPPEGDPLYNEIWDTQVNSLPASTLWKIYRWQESPDLGHWNRKHSQGHMTQQEWPSVKDLLDKSKPVTLTLIASSNDVNLKHLEDSHRVVAYAYEERSIIQGEGAPSGADTHVTIFIYDPIYFNDDDVCLTFYLNGDQSNIRLRHNRGDEYHGFFLDDKDRSYAFQDGTLVKINKCEQTGISSATVADYDLDFSWQCCFIPYFCVQVDGSNWNYNKGPGQAKSELSPKGRDNKQCSSRTGSTTVNLKLPRALSTVTVRLLDDDNYCRSTNVDAVPAIDCYPYVHKTGGGPPVGYDGITDADLFIKDQNPTTAAILQLDAPFRWIRIVNNPIDVRRGHDDLSTAYVEVTYSYRLGNITSPIFAVFVERNLAPPTRTSGVVIIKHGQTTAQNITLSTLSVDGQKIFDGFTNNPFDYDNDTAVEFNFQSVDKFNTVAKGQFFFYGKSIIYVETAVTIYAFDAAKVARLERALHDLIERGLIDITVELPQIPGTGNTPFPPLPQPKPIDPVVLLKKLRAHRRLQSLIDQTLEALWSKSDIWKEIWKIQSEILKQADQDRMIHVNKKAKSGEILRAAHEVKEAEQRKYDGVILNTFVQKTIEQLSRNPTVIDKLKTL